MSDRFRQRTGPKWFNNRALYLQIGLCWEIDIFKGLLYISNKLIEVISKVATLLKNA